MAVSYRHAVAVIDVEAFSFPRGGSNRRPVTTLIPFVVSVAKVQTLTGTPITSRTWFIRPDGLDQCGAQDRVTVRCALSRCKNRRLLDRARQEGRPVQQVLGEVLENVKGMRCYARGVAMEQRFLSGIGLCGEEAIQREAVALCPAEVVDLASCGCPAFPACQEHDPEDEVLFFSEHAARAERERAEKNQIPS